MPKEENEKSAQKSDEKKPDIATVKEKSYKSGKPVLVGAIIVLIILFIILGLGMFRFAWLNNNGYDWNMRGKGMTYYGNDMPHMDNNIYIQSSSSNGSSSTNSIILSGVVVSVSGSSFDIAGNGSRVTVKINGSTTYNNSDKKVSVNDSVIVAGTKSGNTITASDVRINNL